jgi:hypothetical protein
MTIKYVMIDGHRVVCRSHTTEIAGRGCVGIRQVTAGEGNVWVHVLATCLPRRRCYVDELDRRTVDLLSTNS